MAVRLSKRDWIRHALVTLAKEGPDKLKVATMSSRLNVSRGSFYWHFRDAADFRDQILRKWQDRTTEQVVRDLEADQTHSDRLKTLLHRAFGGGLQLDRAIRSWATQDMAVAAVVASVDARRINYVASLIAARGIDESRALQRATVLYWAYLGQAEMLGNHQRQLAPLAIDQIAALFTRED